MPDETKSARLLMRGDSVALPTPFGTELEGLVVRLDINVTLDSGMIVTVPAEAMARLVPLPEPEPWLEDAVSELLAMQEAAEQSEN